MTIQIGTPPAGIVQKVDNTFTVTERCGHCDSLLTKCTARTLREVIKAGMTRPIICPDCHADLAAAPEVALNHVS